MADRAEFERIRTDLEPWFAKCASRSARFVGRMSLGARREYTNSCRRKYKNKTGINIARPMVTERPHVLESLSQ